jgi:hypothetical protein
VTASRAVALVALAFACSRGSYVHEDGLGTLDAGKPDAAPLPPLPENTEFTLRPEFDGPCEKADRIDVNLGHAPEAFVRAAHCQVAGSEPAAALVAEWSEQLRSRRWVRRIDVVRSLCAAAGRSDCALSYSDPWQAQVALTAPCTPKTARDVGAVLMFFSQCPDGVNCNPDWANTHASGMRAPHQLFGFDTKSSGYYHPDNAGFWKRELLDARWAGLRFVLLNTYGPDLVRLPALNEALLEIGEGIGIALFDDTWSWRDNQPAPYSSVPDLAATEAAAQAIFTHKWRPFYRAIDPVHWYRVQGRPLIYFYNAGTLKPLNRSAAVVARLKQLFSGEFGVEPFVAVDRAYFQDPGMPAVADSEFIWDTFATANRSHFDLKGVTHDHFMVKWDALGRDQPGAIASESDRLVKDTERLTQALEESASSDLVVFGTWNDLGEGTGIHRNYDYYFGGQWQPPHAFMRILRKAECE